MNSLARFCVATALLASAAAAPAATISFEDLGSRDRFSSLGIDDSYQGYRWGYGWSGGVSERIFSDNIAGWASATVFNTAVTPAPSNVDGTSYTWTWAGVQSLWIDFGGPTGFVGGDFAYLSPSFGGGNSSTVQLFGYDAADNLVATSTALTLGNGFQTLTANFGSIRYLEIRSDREGSWFSVDRLVTGVAAAEVPEPGMLCLLGLGFLGVAVGRRRKVA